MSSISDVDVSPKEMSFHFELCCNFRCFLVADFVKNGLILAEYCINGKSNGNDNSMVDEDVGAVAKWKTFSFIWNNRIKIIILGGVVTHYVII